MPDFTNAIPRKPSDKLGEHPSVLDWIPQALHADIYDGSTVTDVSTYIASAWNEIKADGVGGTLLFPPGTYNVSTAIVVTMAVPMSIIAEPGTATIVSSIAEPGANQGVLDITGDGTSALRISGLTITHTGATGPGNRDCIRIDNAGTVELSNISTNGASAWGILVNSAVHATLDNCVSENNKYGGASVAGHAVVSGGSYSYNGTTAPTNGYGLTMGGSGSSGSHVSGARFVSNKRYGIDARYSRGTTLDGNYIFDSGFIGIQADNYGTNGADCSNLKIINNTIDMNSNATSVVGIQVGSYFATTETPSIFGELEISGNVIKNSPYHGIELYYYKVANTDANRMQRVHIHHNSIDCTGANSIGWAIFGDQPLSGGIDQLIIDHNAICNGGININVPLLASTMWVDFDSNQILITNGVTLAYGLLCQCAGTCIDNRIVTAGTGTATIAWAMTGTPTFLKGNSINSGLKYPAEFLQDFGTHIGLGTSSTYTWPLSIFDNAGAGGLVKFTQSHNVTSSQGVVNIVSALNTGSALDVGTWTSNPGDWGLRVYQNADRGEASAVNSGASVKVFGVRADGAIYFKPISKFTLGSPVEGLFVFDSVTHRGSYYDNVGWKTLLANPLPAGTIAAGTAPLKFTSGPLLTAPEAGAMEYNGSLWFTPSADRLKLIFDGSETFELDGTAVAFTMKLAVGGTLVFNIDNAGDVTKFGKFAGPVLSQGAAAALQVKTAGGTSMFLADVAGAVSAVGLTLSGLATASSPLRASSARAIETGKIDLTTSADVSASISDGNILYWSTSANAVNGYGASGARSFMGAAAAENYTSGSIVVRKGDDSGQITISVNPNGVISGWS
jgi:parallel beta-helix repeat protein